MRPASDCALTGLLDFSWVRPFSPSLGSFGPVLPLVRPYPLVRPKNLFDLIRFLERLNVLLQSMRVFPLCL